MPIDTGPIVFALLTGEQHAGHLDRKTANTILRGLHDWQTEQPNPSKRNTT